MTNFGDFKRFFQFLRVEHYPWKHWLDTTSWTMVEAVHNLMLWTINVVIYKTLFISMNCDEATIVNNQSWLSIHLYVINGWKWVPILLNLQRVLDSVIFTELITHNFVEFERMTEIDVANKLVYLKANGMTIF